MTTLDGRVAVVTGAGRGLGREHALLLAAEGACVVVNDLGGDAHGSGFGSTAADEVVAEILGDGGRAVANHEDVADWDGAQRLIASAIEHFGDVHVLVNNAGILRDRMLVNMTEDDWDSVLRVHLRGTFAPTRWAAAYWREQAKAGTSVRASVVNTSSGSGLQGNPGQVNYASAKAGIAAFTLAASKELARYGVRVNAIAPMARTRLTEGSPEIAAIVEATTGTEGFDIWDPANVAPLVAYLATEACPLTGQVLGVYGADVVLCEGWRVTTTWSNGDRRWTVEELSATVSDHVEAASHG